MRLVRFQQKPSENRMGIMIDSARLVELSASKNSEPILDYLQDPKREAKANQTLEAAKKQIADSGERIRRESSTSTRSPFSLLSHAQQRSSAWAGTSPTISKKDQQALLPSQYHFSNHQPH